VRTASPLVGIAALLTRLHRRAFIFSGSNVSDFTLETMSSGVNRALYRFGVQRADAVVVQSSDQRSLAREAFPSLHRVVPIPSFAETAHLKDARGAAEAFLWFGRSVRAKQPLKYVELARAVPEARFRMIPVPQGGDTRLLDELRTAADELPNLELLDPLPHAQAAELVERAVAVVNTSVLEGMPNTFLEAWASGVPVLTLQFDPDGTVERHGLGISAAGSWEAFVGGARDLWRSRSDRRDVARRVRSYVESAHSEEAVAARWSTLVDETREARRR
jgi:glycosyltransferase involved in cell wall biosynthesis